MVLAHNNHGDAGVHERSGAGILASYLGVDRKPGGWWRRIQSQLLQRVCLALFQISDASDAQRGRPPWHKLLEGSQNGHGFVWVRVCHVGPQWVPTSWLRSRWPFPKFLNTPNPLSHSWIPCRKHHYHLDKLILRNRVRTYAACHRAFTKNIPEDLILAGPLYMQFSCFHGYQVDHCSQRKIQGDEIEAQ